MKLSIVLITVLMASLAHGKVRTQLIEYQVDDVSMRGYLAWDDAQEGKQPGVLVIHEWWGLTDYPKMRARQLAELGYVAFALDMYGEGKTTDDPKQAAEWAGELRKDPDLAMRRARTGLEQLRAQSTIDPNRVAAIGYCFGGTMVMNMARAGMDIDGAVSFHGSFGNLVPVVRTNVPVLVLNGEADKMVTREQLMRFDNEMTQAGSEVEIINYPDAVHSFTNPEADQRKMDNIAYNKAADEQSWEAMKRFFDDIFAE